MSSGIATGRWRLEGTTARLTCAGFRGVVDLLRPARGLHDVHLAGSALPAAALLGVQLNLAGAAELSLPETYVRGDDLVATYLQTEERPFRLQTYWRFIDPATIAGCRDAVLVELQVSINTSLLDTRPFVDVATVVAGALAGDVGCNRFLVCGEAENRSFFEAAHPADASTSQSTVTADGVRLVHRLFDRPLEKGVILRSRIRGAFVPRADDRATAEAIWREFKASEPPLTT